VIDCEEVLREVELYLDEELLPEDRRQIEEHLAACGDCLSKAEFRERLRELIAAKCGTEAVPPSLLERIRSKLEKEA
jgi:mycothiol system anti-sigma-R factor